MKNIILISLIVLIACMPANAKRMFAEAEYQNYWCSNHNGITEYELKDFTRVDCLTETQAIEFDFANKWAECIGQSFMTHKQPACVLIMERGNKDLKYLKRLRRVAYKKGISTYTMKPDVLLKLKFLEQVTK